MIQFLLPSASPRLRAAAMGRTPAIAGSRPILTQFQLRRVIALFFFGTRGCALASSVRWGLGEGGLACRPRWTGSSVSGWLER